MISKMLHVLRMASPLAVAVALLFSGGKDASAAQAVVSGEFIGSATLGTVPDPDPKDPPGGVADELVAVVVNDPGPTGARVIRAYICDGDASAEGDAEWFTGTITSDIFNLTSASGDASIQGQLTETAVTGTATLADGRTLNFRAVPASAGAGLFEVFFLPDDRLGGLSASGATLNARIVQESTQGARTTRAVAGTINVLGGLTIPLTEIGSQVLNDNGTDLQATVIVLPNATQVKGRGAELKRGQESNLVWSIIEGVLGGLLPREEEEPGRVEQLEEFEDLIEEEGPGRVEELEPIERVPDLERVPLERVPVEAEIPLEREPVEAEAP